jgi:tetratricopeptide (TPR) repeat protein
MNRSKDMLRAYRKFIEIDPENAEATSKIGEALLTRNMVDDAMVFLEMANALKENDPRIMTMLAKGYIRTNRSQEGAKLIEKVVKIAKGSIDDELRVVLADVYLESGKNKEAVEVLKSILDKKRDNIVLLKYAKALYAVNRLPEAVNAIEDIKATDPENIEAHMILGKIRVAQKKYDEAIETYKEVLYINSEYAPALCERANVYTLQNKIQWAKTFYERTLRADPKYALAELGLARLAKSQKDFASYQDHLDKARKLDPNNREILDEARSGKR